MEPWRIDQSILKTLGLMAVFATAGATMASASSSGYVYVAVPAAACAQASPCAAPRVLVVDAATAEVATSIELPVHTAPRGIAVSADGTRLYVSNFGAEFGASNSLTVIDARHNVLLRTLSLSSTQYGKIAVGSPDRVSFWSVRACSMRSTRQRANRSDQCRCTVSKWPSAYR